MDVSDTLSGKAMDETTKARLELMRDLCGGGAPWAALRLADLLKPALEAAEAEAAGKGPLEGWDGGNLAAVFAAACAGGDREAVRTLAPVAAEAFGEKFPWGMSFPSSPTGGNPEELWCVLTTFSYPGGAEKVKSWPVTTMLLLGRRGSPLPLPPEDVMLRAAPRLARAALSCLDEGAVRKTMEATPRAPKMEEKMFSACLDRLARCVSRDEEQTRGRHGGKPPRRMKGAARAAAGRACAAAFVEGGEAVFGPGFRDGLAAAAASDRGLGESFPGGAGAFIAELFAIADKAGLEKVACAGTEGRRRPGL